MVELLNAREKKRVLALVSKEVRAFLAVLRKNPLAGASGQPGDYEVSIDFELELEELMENIGERYIAASPARTRALKLALDKADADEEVAPVPHAGEKR